MSSKQKDPSVAVVTTIHASRRQFLRGLVAAGVAGAAAIGSRQALAQPAGLEKISEDDPAAKADRKSVV